jgi:HSP20 family protein
MPGRSYAAGQRRWPAALAHMSLSVQVLRSHPVRFDDLHNEVLRVFNDACSVRTQRPVSQQGFCPPADVYFEGELDEIVVRLEVPGLDRDNISLLVDRRQLIVSGERRFPVGEGRSYQQVELDYGPFERRLRFTVDIDADRTTASYEHGILEVRLALAPGDRGICQVPIRTAETD